MLLVMQAGSIGNNIVAMFIFDRSFFVSVFVSVAGRRNMLKLILAKITVAERSYDWKLQEDQMIESCKEIK